MTGGRFGLIAGMAFLLVVAQLPAQLLPMSAAASQDDSGIGQRTWQWLQSEYADGTSVDASDPSIYTVTFGLAGRMSIRADCNTGAASYTLSGDQISIQPGPMTLAACGPDSQDTTFLTDLFSAVSYGFDDQQQLFLNFDADRGYMLLSEMPPPSLSGGIWLVTGINNGRGAVSSVVAGTLVTANFGEDSRLSGQTGCNSYQTTYTTDDSTIATGPVATTRRACPSAAAATQEQAFLAALAASSTYELDADKLTLRNADGAAQLTMIRRPQS
jgi:heat shock protein HslJ